MLRSGSTSAVRFQEYQWGDQAVSYLPCKTNKPRVEGGSGQGYATTAREGKGQMYRPENASMQVEVSIENCAP